MTNQANISQTPAGKTMIYYFRSRPPAIGTYPTDGRLVPGSVEAFIPRQNIETKMTDHLTIRRHVWGKVEYNRALTPDEVWKWELLPEDPIQWALFVAWEEVKSASDNSLWVFESYHEAIKGGNTWDGDRVAEAVKIFMDHDMVDWEGIALSLQEFI
jgi:hypothetical protein